jgi:hypothetical protein
VCNSVCIDDAGAQFRKDTSSVAFARGDVSGQSNP